MSRAITPRFGPRTAVPYRSAPTQGQNSKRAATAGNEESIRSGACRHRTLPGSGIELFGFDQRCHSWSVHRLPATGRQRATNRAQRTALPECGHVVSELLPYGRLSGRRARRTALSECRRPPTITCLTQSRAVSDSKMNRLRTNKKPRKSSFEEECARPFCAVFKPPRTPNLGN